ncbi:FadR/GntR family transcriptional regulator [Mycobacterium branderi]|uniref:GntR family transcriptional regulator n=1 Tax=Mycobacterium branderi TaxID=43348 RepID=A0AA91LZL1_9MYCO|nr:FCD domain-containing protein [Mycobacterium branderi]MCV7231632.1 FadR family transcriptional regulator [Mycobacterium branderi]ORA40478.1 GntR family transcriptional regulator [Mycobacterium branderi]
MEVDSLREPKMAERVATVLRKMMVRGEIAEGTMLPPESELIERFGVSRPTLREAFRVLESESLIKIRRGVHGGARVNRPRRQTLARYAGLILEYDGVTVRDVYAARAAIETPMVVQLAKDRDPAALEQLAQIVAREAELEGSDAVDAGTEFHAAIAKLSGNQTLQMISEMLHHIIEKANRSLQPSTGPAAEQATRRASKTHRMVLELIRAGDSEKAAELWDRHLRKAEEYVLSGAELSTVVDLLQ